MGFEPYNSGVSSWREISPKPPEDDPDAMRIAYLKALRGPQSPPPPESAVPTPDTTVAEERRRNPRFKCEGNMEMRTDGSTIRTWTTFRDLSLSGCYVEMMTTYPPGTKMDLSLELKGHAVRTAGVVRVTYPFLGMGIEFEGTSAADRAQLEQMIAALAASAERETKSASYHANTLKPDMDPVPKIVMPEAVVDAVIDFFEGANTLTREEFIVLVNGAQRKPL